MFSWVYLAAGFSTMVVAMAMHIQALFWLGAVVFIAAVAGLLI